MTTDQKPAANSNGGPFKFNFVNIINLVMFAGLIVLGGLYFTGIQEQGSSAAPANVQMPDPGSANIAYVNSQKLMDGYNLAESMRLEFESEQKQMEDDLANRQRTFQAEVEKFQKEVTSGMMGSEQAQMKEQQLMQKQQELMQLNDQYSNSLAEKEVTMNNQLFETINAFLEKYNSEKGYDFILSYSRGGNVLFAKDSLDITDEILERMNAEHSSANNNN